MNKLIKDIAEKLSNYREDESDKSVRISEDGINAWITQFDEELRLPILTELDHIFEHRYCSKERGKQFLRSLLTVLTKDLKLKSGSALLRNSQFLNLQQPRKSQNKMLGLLDEILTAEYGLSLNDCGSESHCYSIYIDDVLCSGLTFISNLQTWAEQENRQGQSNKTAVEVGSTKLIVAYIFIHEKNYHKKIAEAKFKISKRFSQNINIYRMVEIENSTADGSKIDLLLPTEADQPEEVDDYRQQIIKEVDAHTLKYAKESIEEFYRAADKPQKESFFTSSENRKLVEDAFLMKGIEILGKANVHNKNMRALGYSMPSVKNFGFGALCFTWRNVPNNTPLVFWYAGGGFTPLFKVFRGGDPLFNFTFGEANDFDDLV